MLNKVIVMCPNCDNKGEESEKISLLDTYKFSFLRDYTLFQCNKCHVIFSSKDCVFEAERVIFKPEKEEK